MKEMLVGERQISFQGTDTTKEEEMRGMYRKEVTTTSRTDMIG